jgi:hypothetical protein
MKRIYTKYQIGREIRHDETINKYDQLDVFHKSPCDTCDSYDQCSQDKHSCKAYRYYVYYGNWKGLTPYTNFKQIKGVTK